MRFLNGDCLCPATGIASLADASVDIAIVDPPYGIDYQPTNPRFKSILNDKTPYTPWLEVLYPKMTEGGRLFIFYRWDVMHAFVAEAKRVGFKPVWDLVWDKVQHGMGDLRGAPGARHEPFMYFTKGRYRFTGKRPVTILRHNKVYSKKMVHPHEKPVELYREILNFYATPGEVMVDPFAGSAASIEAGVAYGMECTGWELDDEYYAAARDRLDRMFSSPDGRIKTRRA